MVLFFTCTLGVSLVAMATLLLVKRYELTTGKVIFSGLRPGIGAFFQTISRWASTMLPGLAQQYIERAWRFVRTKVQRAIAYSIVTFERLLEQVLSAVRARTEEVHPDREPSAFLREVADHKKKLLQDRSEE